MSRKLFSYIRKGISSKPPCGAFRSLLRGTNANYTQALYDARELAMERMQAEAVEAKAEGIVGVDLHERSHGWGSHVIEFFAIGTAIIPSEGGEDHVIPAPQTVLDLS